MNVKIGDREVGHGRPTYVVAEIGINHNGELSGAKALIDVAAGAGCQAVKFQKRTLDVVYTPEELERPRESPFGTTNGDLKRGLEFGEDEYREIAAYATERGLDWFASCWDEASVDFIARLKPVAFKVASASLTDDALLAHHRTYDLPVILSTGMSSWAQIERAVRVLGRERLVVLHSTSAYPAAAGELNLRVLQALREHYGVPVGYSGHEAGLAPTIAAVALGACLVERHITLDRAAWGSDQAASLEPAELRRLVEDIRTVELALGDGTKRVTATEAEVMKKLRRVG